MRQPSALSRHSKSILIYGVLGGLLIAALRLIEYRYLAIEHSVELYGGLVAFLFAGVGIWLGVSLTRNRPPRVVVQEVRIEAPSSFVQNAEQLQASGITARELEILTLIAEGLSNREIAERIFLSENTVKTHSRRLFDKLQAKRRTQVVQIAKERGLIP